MGSRSSDGNKSGWIIINGTIESNIIIDIDHYSITWLLLPIARLRCIQSEPRTPTSALGAACPAVLGHQLRLAGKCQLLLCRYLLARRSLSDLTEPGGSVVFAGEDTPLKEVGRTAGTPWTIESNVGSR